MDTPRTLLEAIRHFSALDACRDYFAAIRWPKGPVCPRCDSKSTALIPSRGLWRCKACKKQFSVKIGTIFEDSAIGLEKWLPALWLIVNCKNGISSHELARDLEVTQQTAWFMLHRIRVAMRTGSFSKPLGGEVEADETFIGAKARNMHVGKRRQKITGTGASGKVAVMGLLQRHGEVRLKVVGNTRRKTLHGEIKEHVEPGSALFTDALKSYEGLDEGYVHQVIDHAEAYAKGNVHTNGLENFWSLLKRGLNGTYISVEPFHLFRYLDEQAFRFNHRTETDAERFNGALRNMVGRRLTYKEVTGKADIRT
jgi:transposase-like protein